MEVVVVVVGRGIISRQYISISFDVSASRDNQIIAGESS